MSYKEILKGTSFLALLALSGCASQPANFSDDARIPPQEGIVALSLHTNWHTSSFFAPLVLQYAASTENKEGNRLGGYELTFFGRKDVRVFSLPAGNYHFFGLKLANARLSFADSSAFSVRADEITYIGDISMDVDKKFLLYGASAQWKVEDRHDDMIAALKAEYPKLAASHPMRTQLTRLVAMPPERPISGSDSAPAVE